VGQIATKIPLVRSIYVRDEISVPFEVSSS